MNWLIQWASTNLFRMWLSQFDHGDLNGKVAATSDITNCDVKSAASEHWARQLTAEMDSQTKTTRLRLVSNDETSSMGIGKV